MAKIWILGQIFGLKSFQIYQIGTVGYGSCATKWLDSSLRQRE